MMLELLPAIGPLMIMGVFGKVPLPTVSVRLALFVHGPLKVTGCEKAAIKVPAAVPLLLVKLLAMVIGPGASGAARTTVLTAPQVTGPVPRELLLLKFSPPEVFRTVPRS